MTEKRCARCGAVFTCDATSDKPCWCADLPPIRTIEPEADCRCRVCLEQTAEARVLISG